ncbi:response regulator transcription factor [Reinekea marinisedimentorum]|uniref:DNA-binding response OmpR family regulator n=1 Tax=Reinekea marinisedimentorum TaxID=230495 RepID=A0A4R3HRG1_9GAMM|nr:response regulator transcription factor [Reinekea marinisedimentorum]TCS35697.1 DNA-binding response OmpR family regulator [Reinekea marinisedimentorum]
MTKTLLIIEDEAGIAFMLQDRFESEGYSVVHKDNGPEGEAYARQNSVDVILLDIMLPGKDGFQVCQDLRRSGINTPILMLTARTTNIDTVMGLKLGADDYLTKPFDMAVLSARVEALLRRAQAETPAKPAVQNDQYPFGDFLLDTSKQELYRNGSLVELNTQEYRLLKYLVQNPGRVLSRDELLDAVWGYNSDVTTRTVDVHIAWLRKKIEDNPVSRHLITLRGRGYKFLQEAE